MHTHIYNGKMTLSNNVSMGQGPFGDTTLTKVFVGGLAWETPKEALGEHFEKYGEILEAVIISDKVTGRSKGYGFVTFKEAESAKKACGDAAPIINGRRANCNLASLGARRPRTSSTTPPQQAAPPNVGPRSATPTPTGHVRWYYQPASPATPFHHQAVPFYGYSPTYIATDVGYNQKMSYSGGSYMNGRFSQVYPGQPVMGGNPLMPMYPLYHFPQPQTMGLPAHIYSPTSVGPLTMGPPLITKPTPITPNSGGVLDLFVADGVGVHTRDHICNICVSGMK